MILRSLICVLSLAGSSNDSVCEDSGSEAGDSTEELDDSQAGRCVFSEKQRRKLERKFRSHKYISSFTRHELAAELNLTEKQVRLFLFLHYPPSSSVLCYFLSSLLLIPLYALFVQETLASVLSSLLVLLLIFNRLIF